MTSPDKPVGIEWQADTLRAFAHSNRLKILFMLRRGGQSVGMMARGLGVSETTILKHLAVHKTAASRPLFPLSRQVRWTILTQTALGYTSSCTLDRQAQALAFQRCISSGR